jgi:hypothetical protein
MRVASGVSTIACVGYKFYHDYVCMPAAQQSDKPDEEIAKCYEKYYNVCDRVSGLESPPVCGLPGQNNDGNVAVSSTFKTNKILSGDDFEGGLEFYEDGKLAGRFTELRISESNAKCQDGFISVSGQINKYEESTSIGGSVSRIESEADIKDACVPAQRDASGKITAINLQQAGSLCYSPKAPNFDNTKCSLSLYGVTNQPNAVDGGVPGLDPSTSIFSALQCGAVVDTYKWLEVSLRVQEGIQKCLEQAKIGEINGGYCERLASMAICDLATNQVLPEVLQYSKSSAIAKQNGNDVDPLLRAIQNREISERAYNQRYEGTALSQTGLSTDQLLNTACLGALTGDWSVLETNILSVIEDAEVKPVIGPPVAESRLQGYNPITGEIAIRYQFTHAVVSGGQRVDTKVQLVCDPTAPNSDFCPENTIVYSGQNGYDFTQRTLFVGEDEVVQNNIVITEDTGRYWYNQIQLVHEFDVGNEKRIETQIFNIAHKEEMFGKCNWDGSLFALGTLGESTANGQSIAPVGGISCDTIFTSDSLLAAYEIDEGRTELLPSSQTAFYPGNSILLDMVLSSRGNSENQELALAYMATCPSNGDEQIVLGNNGDIAPHVYSGLDIYGDVSSYSKSVVLFEELEDIGAGIDSYFVSGNVENADNLIMYATSGTNTGVGFIDKVIVNDIHTIDASDLNFGIVEQNLVVNGGSTTNYNKITIQSIVDKVNTQQRSLNPNFQDITISKLRVEFKEEPQNVAYYLGGINSEDKSPNVVRGLTISNGDILSAGTCTLKVRLLPLAQANALVQDNFDTFSPLSSNAENDDLLFDNSFEDSSNIFETKFTLQKKPNTASVNDHFYEVTSPRENSIIALSGSESFSIETFYQNSQNEYKSIDVKIEATLILDQYGEIATLAKVNFREKSKIIELNFDEQGKEKLTTALEALGNSEAGLFQSGFNTLDATLTYRIFEGEQIKKTESVKFKIVQGEKFEDGGGVIG